MSGEDLAAEVVGVVHRTVGKAEKRIAKRAPLHFKVAIVYHQHEDLNTRPTYHGITHDISLIGLSVLVGLNVFTEEDVTVLLAIPPAHMGETQKVIEATAKMVYTVFSSDHDSFRIGLEFLKFKNNGDHFLKKVIEDRHLRVD